MDFVNKNLRNINGQIYKECCRELGIFREVHCFVTMRVPVPRFFGKLLKEFRHTIPKSPLHALADGMVLTGTDNVVLKTRQGDVEINRQILCNTSPTARAIFAVGKQGKSSSYELNYSKAAVVAVLNAAVNKHESLPVDPRRAAPFFLYEVTKLTLSWEIPQLKLWTQVAFVERLCYPVANLDQIPVLDALQVILDHADPNEAGSRMIVCGLISVLRILHSPTARWTLNELQCIIALKPALWKSVILPMRLVPDTCIFVKTLTGKTFAVPVNLAYWVYHLKCWVKHNAVGIPLEQQRLIFEGTQLSGNVTLSDCGITTEATLDLLLRLMSG
ncbi:uncharacterized protein LOC129591485 [Paramacrobiotus metropolitanus]|uniref:uncharacterized protein LOC129591485 n=1 Tax=Paramacrobiotus metropolitanus TaxID=2943436 RepID=UPI002445A932|nr:uncharacterized protein LOC129591485 [Paramacrobiotus metropolitanus]XP_055343140.1 uncharacterized protein LOC129591485 [Paramacrobiotus metropolitanus]